MMQRGWVGDVADLFFFSLQKDYSINIDEVGTNHPIFSFFRQSLSSSSCAPQWFFLPVA